jgi:hypothetical protein
LSKKSLKEEILGTIKEMDLRPDEVELLEDCEMVTNIIIGEVLEMFDDPEMREDILWLQHEHRTPNKQRWINIVELTKSLWGEAGGGDRIKKYHTIESPCREITEEEIESINDPVARETIRKIKHIHDNTLERITRVASKCYYK